MSKYVIVMSVDNDRFKEALNLGHLTNMGNNLFKCSRKYAHDLGLYIVTDCGENDLLWNEK